ncbi:MAG: c-type cytochrome [Ferrovum sp.]|jgi:cytochrome c|nr:c-type cytochrome [Ferrovum sp.]NNM66189.1 c-type cytochrome [Burkholderiales bacterium]
MSNSRIRKVAVAAALGLTFSAAWGVNASASLGRAATPDEIKAWNIDVRPDFQGLPAGQGTVAEGTKLWEAKCASCHGDFADSNSVFPPLVGAFQASKQDIATGRVAKLANVTDGGGTSLEKLSTLSTLFDYIHRAMPWNEPDSLTWNQTYSVVAYLLNLANVVPANYTLTRDNVQQVQNMLPNRNGMTWNHGMWPGKEIGNGGIPDTHNVECMKDCSPKPKVDSFIPAYAMNTWGNLADETRPWGPIRGQVTLTRAELKKAALKKESAAVDPNAKVVALIKANGCIACHSLGDNKLVGPGYKEIAAKYSGKTAMVGELTVRIMQGGSGTWGSMQMPPQSISEADAKMIATWVVDGAKQ